MTVSSSKESYFKTAPEFRNLLTAARRLRRGVNRLGVVSFEETSHNRLLKNLDDLEESIGIHFKELDGLVRDLLAFETMRLTQRQRVLMRWLVEEYRGEMVYTSLIEKVSSDLSMSKSTVRWSFRGLRDGGLIRAGDRDNKGVPVSLTEKGALVAEYLTAGRG